MLAQPALRRRENAVNLGSYLREICLQRLDVLELALSLRLLDEAFEERLLFQQRLQCLRDFRPDRR